MRAGRFACVVVVVAMAAPSCTRTPTQTDAGPPPVDDDVTFTLEASVAADPVAAVVARLPASFGACAQVKSLKSRDEADAAAQAIRPATSLPVSVVEKDLAARGHWFRLCVGNELDAARLTAAATRWTAPGGVLAPFLDPPKAPDEPRFHVLVRPEVTKRRPTAPQALAMVQRSPQGPLHLVGEPALLVGSGPQGTGQGGQQLVVIDAAGKRLHLDPAPPPGCASCAIAERASPVSSRSVLAVGELSKSAGPEVLVEEESTSGARFLAVLTTDGGVLRRAGAVVLSAASSTVILRGAAAVVEADGDDDREIGVSRLELRTMGDNLCALDTRGEVWSTGTDAARGLARLTLKDLPANNDVAVVDFITALDAAHDPTAASRACAEVLADRPVSLVTQLCLQRVRALVADGHFVDAVNAAGALAERSSGLRAAVAAPLFVAMSALDGDARLSSSPRDCNVDPLAIGVSSRSLADTIALARTRLSERVSLVDVSDAVFVTASRDFGADTPVGTIAARWMERLRVGQPARHAAIEAALLPPQAEPEPSTPGESAPVVGPGFGGTP
jgi:hypothetical protein